MTMKISKQTWYIIGGSAAILGLLGFLYFSNKSKKAALEAADTALAEANAKGETIKYITVTPKTTTTSTSIPTASTTTNTSTIVVPKDSSTWKIGDWLYAKYDNVGLSNYNSKLTFNKGDIVGTLDSIETVSGAQLAHVKNNGKIYYSGVSFLTN